MEGEILGTLTRDIGKDKIYRTKYLVNAAETKFLRRVKGWTILDKIETMKQIFIRQLEEDEETNEEQNMANKQQPLDKMYVKIVREHCGI